MLYVFADHHKNVLYRQFLGRSKVFLVGGANEFRHDVHSYIVFLLIAVP